MYIIHSNWIQYKISSENMSNEKIIYYLKNHLISLKLSARVASMKLFRVCLKNPKNRYDTNNCVIKVAYAAPVIP